MSTDDQPPVDVDRSDDHANDAIQELPDEALEHISGGGAGGWANQNPQSPFDN